MNSLIALADQENISVSYDNVFKRFHTLGLYNSDGATHQIILDNTLKNDYRLCRCILAEELGHHFTSVGPTFYKAANFCFWKLNHIKAELKALKWSAFYLMPEPLLQQAINREHFNMGYEFEDYFEVTPQLLIHRLRYVPDLSFLCISDLAEM